MKTAKMERQYQDVLIKYNPYQYNTSTTVQYSHQVSLQTFIQYYTASMQQYTVYSTRVFSTHDSRSNTPNTLVK